MTGSTYTADKWTDVQASQTAPSSQGTTATCAANSTTNVDVVLTDDCFIRGIEFLANGAVFGDTVTLQVIDTGGVISPPGTVLLTPVTNWNVETDNQKTIDYLAVVPKKALGTFTLRAIYKSTSLIVPVQVAINYQLLKVLS